MSFSEASNVEEPLSRVSNKKLKENESAATMAKVSDKIITSELLISTLDTENHQIKNDKNSFVPMQPSTPPSSVFLPSLSQTRRRLTMDENTRYVPLLPYSWFNASYTESHFLSSLSVEPLLDNPEKENVHNTIEFVNVNDEHQFQ